MPLGRRASSAMFQRVEHESGGECGGHRPADDATAEGIEHDGEIEARPVGM